ncbi:hypothetical protein HMPREF3293_00349 [Christensenella minuta]|uniref:Uncharacterized protein n=1 Tax=Christensenella minuta TaxID=626937 RepID=A0A136Q7Z8_9FIRM|nr:hypothetical protein HMPREF3293_00349 [Christensenella minuta]
MKRKKSPWRMLHGRGISNVKHIRKAPGTLSGAFPRRSRRGTGQRLLTVAFF